MRRTALTLTVASLLAACQPATPPANQQAEAASPAATSADATPAAPTPDAPASDAHAQPPLPAAALAVLRKEVGADAGELRYFGRGIDLDGDGRDELVVHLNGLFVCGSGGCNTYILQADANSQWRIVTSLPTTRAPIVAAASRSNGWRDLIIRVSGGGGDAGEARVKFDGKRYVKNDEATKIALDTPGIDLLIPDYQSGDEGQPLP